MGGLKPGQEKAAADDQLFQYLNALLQQAEAASGRPELELRAKIDALRTETRKVPTPAPTALSEIEVASRLDELSAKMESVNKLLKEVEGDCDAQEFLSSSSALWMPVITATAEQRRATSSSSNPTNKGGTDQQ